ncbi:MAG: hypothetical protein A2042_02050 [Candidatus Schekmanbacteria bacterium GWA2_38_11]|uniref:Uncharacterized protein n=1 Tax=Candidatus Schekmanbacteria bacterium GWA2_38_11 TaxID=1817876 RepID=A0A1F7RM41_9BACT|nr:MAG: hypothetical protein A2042_02050 [Candidatus Schekmanbacteria bacterium GWA2_38_11]
MARNGVPKRDFFRVLLAILDFFSMDKDKKYFPKSLKRFLVFTAYGLGVLLLLMSVAAYWLVAPYTEPEPTSRFVSKDTDGFISVKFDPAEPGLSEFASSISLELLKSQKSPLKDANLPPSFVRSLESDEEKENIKLFLPYEIGYLFSFKKNDEKPSQITVINLRYFKNFFKIFIKSFIQAKPELVNLSGENPEKTLFLFPVFQNEKNGKSENSLTFYGNDIIYLTTKKFFETAVEAYMENKTPFYEKPELRDMYNRLILAEDITFLADNREYSLSRFIDLKTKGSIPRDFFDEIDILAGNADVRRGDLITGIVYLNLKKDYDEKKFREEMYQLKARLEEVFNLRIEFQLEKPAVQDYYILKFECRGLTKLVVQGINGGYFLS